MPVTYPLTLPSTPGFRSASFKPRSAVAVARSPFSFAEQAQAYDGQMWETEREYPRMTRAQAEALNAKIAALNGREGTFYLSPPYKGSSLVPRGTATGSPVVRYRRNILTYSEQFNQAGSWTLTGATISANAATAPTLADGHGGDATMDKLVESSGGTSHQVAQNLSGIGNGDIISISVFAKAGERNWISLRAKLRDGTNRRVFVNLTTGAIGTNGGSGGGTVSVQSMGGGIYRIGIAGIDVQSGATTPDIQVLLCDADNSASYSGDGASGAYIWGASVVEASDPGFYVVTTTVAVDPETPSAGAQGLYLDGWTASTTGILLAGDFIQLNSGSAARLHQVLGDQNSDPWGNAYVDLWPRLREAPANASAVTTTNPVGVFRLTDWDLNLDALQQYGGGFNAEEVV